MDVNGFFHIDETGNTLYSDRYSWCGNYQEETCVVRDREGSSLYLDLNGKPLFNRKFLYAGDFKDGYDCIKTEKGWTHINLTGNLLHGKYFSDLGVYHKGFATARDEKGWFHIDRSGTPIYQERYQMVEPFYNGVALVWENEWRMKFICKE
ncbi:MAG: WG repeat-containing protein [Bacteroidetes bacterium]|nr:WG repeat-containing protein [Bacteroidota bacterium]